MRLNQLSRIFGQTCKIAGAPANVDLDIGANRPAGLLEALQEGSQARLCFRFSGGGVHEYTDPSQIPLELGIRGCRHRRSHAYRQSEKFPPSHCHLNYSITSSARPASGCGTLMPSAFAVLRLMIISTLLDCTTGKLTGFSPLRILPA